MTPRIEDVARLVGGDVFDEYGRVIGVLVSFSSTVEGTVEFIEVKIVDRGLEKVEGERVKVKDGRLVVTPQWKHKAVKIIEALDRAYRRRNALEQIEASDVPGSVVEQMKRRLEEEIKKLRLKAEESIEEINARLARIEDESLHIARAIALIKMSYLSGEIGERNYENGIEHLRKLKKTLTMEKEDAKQVLTRLDKTLKALISPKPKLPEPKTTPVKPQPQPTPHATPAAEGVIPVKIED